MHIVTVNQTANFLVKDKFFIYIIQIKLYSIKNFTNYKINYYKGMLYQNNLPKEILDLIFQFSGINCKVCQCKFNSNFLFRENKNYYCSELCYNFI